VRHGSYGGDPSVEIVYDSRLGVYVVVGRPHHYFHDGRYLRTRSGVWEASATLDGGWLVVGSGQIPATLRATR
jgi:hypothetical protein